MAALAPLDVRYTPRASTDVGELDFDAFERLEETLERVARDLAAADPSAPGVEIALVDRRVVRLRHDPISRSLFVLSIARR